MCVYNYFFNCLKSITHSNQRKLGSERPGLSCSTWGFYFLLSLIKFCFHFSFQLTVISAGHDLVILLHMTTSYLHKKSYWSSLSCESNYSCDSRSEGSDLHSFLTSFHLWRGKCLLPAKIKHQKPGFIHQRGPPLWEGADLWLSPLSTPAEFSYQPAGSAPGPTCFCVSVGRQTPRSLCCYDSIGKHATLAHHTTERKHGFGRYEGVRHTEVQVLRAQRATVRAQRPACTCPVP